MDCLHLWLRTQKQLLEFFILMFKFFYLSFFISRPLCLKFLYHFNLIKYIFYFIQIKIPLFYISLFFLSQFAEKYFCCYKIVTESTFTVIRLSRKRRFCVFSFCSFCLSLAREPFEAIQSFWTGILPIYRVR